MAMPKYNWQETKKTCPVEVNGQPCGAEMIVESYDPYGTVYLCDEGHTVEEGNPNIP